VLLARSDFARHASRRVGLGAGDVCILASMEACLVLFVVVLAFWQWRLSGRARVRLLIAMYASLTVAFCGFCWHDITLAAQDLPRGPDAPSAYERVVEQTLAVGVTMGALVVGLAAVAAVLWLERRSLNPQAERGTLDTRT
jgi:hypothetical protein